MQTSRMAVQAIATFALVATVGAAQTPPPTPPKPVDLSAVKQGLIAMRTAQEVYFTSNNSYTPIVGALKMDVTEGVTLKILEASKSAWAGVGMLAGASGVSCVMFVGYVSVFPKTEKGVQAKAEGEAVCDGIPSTVSYAPSGRRSISQGVSQR